MMRPRYSSVCRPKGSEARRGLEGGRAACAGPREVRPGGDWKEAATDARGEGERGALEQMRALQERGGFAWAECS